MKYLACGILAASLSAVGCTESVGKPGGPGATNASTKQPLVGQIDDTFSLSTKSISVKQDDTSPTTVGIKRGTNFSQDVTVSFADLPKGISAEPATPVIKNSSTEAKFNISASEDVLPGEYIVKVLGHPATGSDASNQFTLTVGKKDTFSLSVPFWTTALKQGETKSVTISISRDKKFDQDVTLKLDSLPKGVSAIPAVAVIKNGESEVSFSLKADADAALGDFSVTIDAHPTKGADANHVFKFSIAKK
jgi:uncharacterized membrane protein